MGRVFFFKKKKSGQKKIQLEVSKCDQITEKFGSFLFNVVKSTFFTHFYEGTLRGPRIV